jgi:glycosyltransferase involved in cell wall biosynthesis
MIRVALDARWMQQTPRGGVGRALANLLPLLAEEVDLHLLTDSGGPTLATGLPEHGLPTPWPRRAAAWLQWSAPRFLASFDDGIFHCPWYGLPYRHPVPMVVTLHDLTFEHRPEWFPRAQRQVFVRQARHAARIAAAILTPSEHVRQDIVETYRVAPERVLVAPQGADPAFMPGLDPGPVLERLGVTAPYVVALGGAERRNLALAVSAWALVPGAGALVVVGPDLPPARPGVFAAGPLDDSDWAALLSGATALLYPTAYEGFGMPALEALAAGTPVVCAPVGSLPEVLGDCASWAASLSPEDLAAALDRVVTDGAGREALCERGLKRARDAPGWEASARVHVEAYRRAAGR